VLRIMLAMAEWQLDRLRSSWDIASERAIARGAYVGAPVPTGYRKLRSGRLRPDPHVAALITERFSRRAAGESLAVLERRLEDEAVPTIYGNPVWLPASVRALVAKRVDVGEVRYGRSVREHAHRALTDEAIWQAAQQPPVARQPPGAHTALLGGLVRCTSCGMRMHLRGHRRGYEYHSCQRRCSAGHCVGPDLHRGDTP
jgi:Recombinase